MKIDRWWKKTLLALVVLLLAVRIILPTVIRNQANAFLADYSKVFSAHIGDVDLSFIRMAYRMEDLEVKMRKGDQLVFQVDAIDVSLAWRELLRGRLLSDIYVTGADVMATPEVLPALKQAQAEAESKKEVKDPDVKSKLFPIRIERLVVRDSSFEFAPEKDTPKAQRFLVDNGQIRVSNVTPLKDRTKTMATFEADVMDSGKVKGVAQVRLSEEQMDWDIDSELREFQLTKANPFLRKMVPFTFTAGRLDLFMEAKSEGGSMVGYVKPFLTKVDVMKNEEEFKNTRHVLAEIVTAIGNVVAQRPEQKSVATKVDFTKPGPEAGIKVDVMGALANAIEHKLDEQIAPSIEDEIKLKK